MKKRIILIITLLIFLIAICPDKLFALQPKALLPAGMTIKKMVLKEQASDYKLEMNYPEVRWSNHPKVEQLTNQQIKAVIEMAKADFLKDREKPFNGFNNGISTEYSVVCVDEKILSLRFNSLVYFAGAAHPRHWISTLNFDLLKGKQLWLPDLFAPGRKYLKTISDYCIKELLKRGEIGRDQDWVRKGAGPDPKNYQYFNLTDKELIITFPDYQVAPYAAGEQEVSIPLEQLTRNLK